MIFILAGVFHFVYSVLFRKHTAYYTKPYKKRSEMKVIKLNEFLKLQFFSALFNALFLVTYGVVMIRFQLNNVFFFPGLLLFHFINFILIVVSKKKGYIDYKAGKLYK